MEPVTFIKKEGAKSSATSPQDSTTTAKAANKEAPIVFGSVFTGNETQPASNEISLFKPYQLQYIPIEDKTTTTPLLQIKLALVMLDAGHGGKDTGAIAKDGTREATINQNIKNEVAKILEADGIKTISTDPKTNKYKRQSFRDETQPNLFVSIHANSNPDKHCKGIETFYYTQNSKKLATNIQDALISETKSKNLGVKNYDYGVLMPNLRGKTPPSALVETGFITNTEELKELKTPEGIHKRAASIVEGILKTLAEE